MLPGGRQERGRPGHDMERTPWLSSPFAPDCRNLCQAVAVRAKKLLVVLRIVLAIWLIERVQQQFDAEVSNLAFLSLERQQRIGS